MYDAVFILCSVIQPQRYQSIPRNTRFAQTVDSIRLIRKKVPNSYCLVVEGSELTAQEHKIFRNISDTLIYTLETNKEAHAYINHPSNIGIGECKLLDIAVSFLQENNIQSKLYFKISARYRLSSDFSIGKFIPEKYCFASVYDKDIKQMIYNTMLFSVPFSEFSDFKRILYEISHSMHYHSMIEKDIKDKIPIEKVHNVPLPLGILGNLSYNNAPVRV